MLNPVLFDSFVSIVFLFNCINACGDWPMIEFSPKWCIHTFSLTSWIKLYEASWLKLALGAEF